MSDTLYFIDRRMSKRVKPSVLNQRLAGTYSPPNATDYTMLALYGVLAVSAYYAFIRR